MSNLLNNADSEKEVKRETLGARLKQLRKNKGVSQQEIANLFRVTRPCVCYWETGKRLPDYQTLIALSTYFEVSIDYLVGKSDDKENIIQNPDLPYQNEDVLKLDELTEQNKKTLKKFYQFLLEQQMLEPSGSRPTA